MPTICVVPRLERNQGGSAQRGLDGSTEATLVCPVTHHCGGSGGRRGTPLMHLQLPHHMNDADVTDVHICTGSYSTRYKLRRIRMIAPPGVHEPTEVGKRVGAAHGECVRVVAEIPL